MSIAGKPDIALPSLDTARSIALRQSGGSLNKSANIQLFDRTRVCVLTGGASWFVDACEKENRLVELVGEPWGEAGGEGINFGTGFL